MPCKASFKSPEFSGDALELLNVSSNYKCSGRRRSAPNEVMQDLQLSSEPVPQANDSAQLSHGERGSSPPPPFPRCLKFVSFSLPEAPWLTPWAAVGKIIRCGVSASESRACLKRRRRFELPTAGCGFEGPCLVNPL